jgi:hypothetical protein
VQEADRITVMMLSERGATLSDSRTVPDDLRKARAAAADEGGRKGTEDMLVALVHYKKVVDAGVGTARMKREAYRRELAS